VKCEFFLRFGRWDEVKTPDRNWKFLAVVQHSSHFQLCAEDITVYSDQVGEEFSDLNHQRSSEGLNCIIAFHKTGENGFIVQRQPKDHAIPKAVRIPNPTHSHESFKLRAIQLISHPAWTACNFIGLCGMFIMRISSLSQSFASESDSKAYRYSVAAVRNFYVPYSDDWVMRWRVENSQTRNVQPLRYLCITITDFMLCSASRRSAFFMSRAREFSSFILVWNSSTPMMGCECSRK